MANLNKVMLIGRLTRDPEIRTFSTGGKVAAFGFAVNNRRKNAQSGQWEDDPVFIDMEAFNRPTGRQLADLVEQYFRKGAQFFIEGHLKFDQWTSQDNQKRSKLKVVVDNFEFFEPRQDGGSGEGGMRGPRTMAPRRPANAPPPAGNYDEPMHEPEPMEGPDVQGDQEIPF
jgi:single-strand DNA-binding protein